MAGNAVDVKNNAELNALVKDKSVVLVDMWADWCGPCKQYGPIFEGVADTYADNANVKFAKVDVDAATDISQAYGVVSIPTTLVFQNGELVDQVRGPIRPKVLANKVDSLL